MNVPDAAVTHYFFRAWSQWEQGLNMEADLNLYQACGLAGVRWPWKYVLPPKRNEATR